MDIPRTDSPVCGFEFPSSAPLTRPSPGWIRALPPSGVASDSKPDFNTESDEHDLCSEAEADLASLVHHLDLSIYSGYHNAPPSLRFSLSSRASCSSVDSLSTIGYTPRSSILHTPTSSMDFNQFNPRSLPKSRSLASVALSPSARRAAVYIVDDEDVEEVYGAAKISYGMEVHHADEAKEEEEEEELHDNPPSRFSIDEEERPPSKRDIWTRSRTVSMTAPSPVPFPRSSPSYPPSPPPPTPGEANAKPCSRCFISRP
ncbi:hypothetical protein BDZ89DRAFT_1063793, partial [Hymenopellis radicata]